MQVPVRGTIRERTVEPYVRLLHDLRRRRRVRGVLLDISSGGGESIASMDLYLAVKRLDAVKPVVAIFGAQGTSGAYLAALGARRLWAYPESLVGSIGVVFPHVAVARLARRLGVDVEWIHAGEHKDAYQGYRPLTEAERVHLQSLADENHELFIELVARERKKSVEEIRALSTGDFWSGRTAKKVGLVDALGDREMALEELAQLTGVPASRTRRWTPPRPWLARLFGASLGPVWGSLREELIEALDDLRLEARGGLR